MNNQYQISNLKFQIKLKVCGLTKPDQIEELISLKIDFLGFIFYEKSPRYVLNHLSFEQISEIPHNGKVGVFVNETMEKIVEISEKANLNFVQLHSDESVDFILNLRQKLSNNIQIIKAVRIGNQTAEELQKILKDYSETTDYFLFDTDSTAFGGTGKSFDWNILNQIEIQKPYFLSGGISMENYEKLKTINNQPYALDINSKFEISAGVKDLEKIKKLKSQLNEKL